MASAIVGEKKADFPFAKKHANMKMVEPIKASQFLVTVEHDYMRENT